MATQSTKTGLPHFFADGGSGDSIRRQIAEGPLEAAKQSAFATAVELFALMSVLPDAFIASQERELKRLRAGNKERDKDPRVQALKASIEQADQLRSTAQLGQARVERALVAMTDSDHLFHGFVSGMDLQPLPGLVVRISARDGGEGKSLSGKTGSDGYFRIRLGDGSTGTKTRIPESPVNLSARIAELLATVNATAHDSARPKADAKAAPAASTSDGKDVLAFVEILDGSGNLLHRDDAPLIVNDGSAYREYVIGDGERANAGDYKDFQRKTAKPAAAPAAEAAKPAAAASNKAKPPAPAAKKAPGKGKK